MTYFVYQKGDTQVITDDPFLYVKLYGGIALVAAALYLIADSLGLYEGFWDIKPEVIFTATPYNQCNIYDEMSSNPKIIGKTKTELSVYKAIDNWLIVKDENNQVGWVNCKVEKHLPK